MSEIKRISVAEAQQDVQFHYNASTIIPTKVGIQCAGEVHAADSLDPHFRGDDETLDFFTCSPCQLLAAVGFISDMNV